MNTLDRFYTLNDQAIAAFETYLEFQRKGDMDLAGEELRTSLLIRNQMRLLAWNSTKVAKAIAESSNGQKVEYDSKLLGV